MHLQNEFRSSDKSVVIIGPTAAGIPIFIMGHKWSDYSTFNSCSQRYSVTRGMSNILLSPHFVVIGHPVMKIDITAVVGLALLWQHFCLKIKICIGNSRIWCKELTLSSFYLGLLDFWANAIVNAYFEYLKLQTRLIKNFYKKVALTMYMN